MRYGNLGKEKSSDKGAPIGDTAGGVELEVELSTNLAR